MNTKALARKLERNYFSYYRLGVGLDDYQCYEMEELVYLLSHQHDAYFNVILHAHLQPEFLHSTVTSLVTQYQQANIPFCWKVGARSAPRTPLMRELERQGFKRHESIMGCWFDFRAHKVPNAAETTPSELAICTVETIQQAREWLLPFQSGFQVDATVKEFVFRFNQQAKHRKGSQFMNLLGSVQGEPVCSSTLVYDAGIACLYDVATVGHHRRKGYGQAMVWEGVRQVSAQHVPGVGLYSTPTGLPLYRKLGFIPISSHEIFSFS